MNLSPPACSRLSRAPPPPRQPRALASRHFLSFSCARIPSLIRVTFRFVPKCSVPILICPRYRASTFPSWRTVSIPESSTTTFPSRQPGTISVVAHRTNTRLHPSTLIRRSLTPTFYGNERFRFATFSLYLRIYLTVVSTITRSAPRILPGIEREREKLQPRIRRGVVVLRTRVTRCVTYSYMHRRTTAVPYCSDTCISRNACFSGDARVREKPWRIKDRRT